jgi:hypothetical protein
MKMKSRITKIIVLAMTMLSMFWFLSGCSNKEKEAGFFRYRIYDIKGMGGKFAEITGLTEEGAKQKVLIVPKEVGGVKVTRLMDSQKFLFDTVGQWKSDVLEKIFLYENYEVVDRFFAECIEIKFVFIINYSHEDMLKYGIQSIPFEIGDKTLCINPFVYFSNSDPWRSFCPANVTYYYNFDNSENYGVYWIDNIAYGTKIETIPEDPIKGGHQFKGWYKEEECVNEWDFDSDTLPDKQINDDEEVYQETKLFAKWK